MLKIQNISNMRKSFFIEMLHYQYSEEYRSDCYHITHQLTTFATITRILLIH